MPKVAFIGTGETIASLGEVGASRGRGVLVMLNDEIHAAREVTKTSTDRLQTFRTPDFGSRHGQRPAKIRRPSGVAGQTGSGVL